MNRDQRDAHLFIGHPGVRAFHLLALTVSIKQTQPPG
jgi:hypothetical protein